MSPYPENEEDVSRYPLDPNHADKKAAWFLEHKGGTMVVVAVEVTETIGEISRTTRYEFDGSAPVEIWQFNGQVYIVSVADAAAGKFPWDAQAAYEAGAR